LPCFKINAFWASENCDAFIVFRSSQPRTQSGKLYPKTIQFSGLRSVRLQLHALAYNFGNFLRTLATPEPIKDWSLTSLKEKLIKIGAKVISHGRYVAFQMAEVAIPRSLFADILRLIAELRPPPHPALA
jgi:hypothetical protein